MVRLFIAIPVPSEIKDLITRLLADQKLIRGLPAGRQGLPREARFVPEENWHFTLVFLGYQEESTVPIIKASLEKFIPSRSYEIKFDKLVYGPTEIGRRVKPPRMLWLTTAPETSKALGEIREILERELGNSGIKWLRENRPFQAHLTLARFLPTPLERLPKIERKIDWRYLPPEIQLMKSVLKRSGAEYETLFSTCLPAGRLDL